MCYQNIIIVHTHVMIIIKHPLTMTVQKVIIINLLLSRVYDDPDVMDAKLKEFKDISYYHFFYLGRLEVLLMNWKIII